jgi:TetR/AcrR family transcriptional regulator, transcriptional repressor for nem operon
LNRHEANASGQIERKTDCMGRVSDARERLMKAVRELIWSGSYGATTIDQICDKAGVKKGSFYYFFDSKAELAVAGVEEEWRMRRPELDAIFSPTVPPLERLRKYCDYGYRFQAEICQKYGCVLGCPLFSVGAEVCTQEDHRLQQKIQEILEYKRKYLESAIRDAHAAGLVNAPDPEAKSRILFAYYQGLQTQARIHNKLEVLKDAITGTYELLGIKNADIVAA